jgi:hypothetical protein
VLLSGGIVGPNLAAAVPLNRISSLAMSALESEETAAPLSLEQADPAVAEVGQQLSVFPSAELQLFSVPLDEDC